MGDEEKNGLFGDIKNPFDEEGDGEGDGEEGDGPLGGIKNPFASQSGDAGQGDPEKDPEKGGGIFGSGSVFGNGDPKDVNKDKKDSMLADNPFATLSKKSEKETEGDTKKEEDKPIGNYVGSFIFWTITWTLIAIFTVYTGTGLYNLMYNDETGKSQEECYIDFFLPTDALKAPYGRDPTIAACNGEKLVNNKQFWLYKSGTQALFSGYIGYWFIEATKYISITLHFFLKKSAPLLSTNYKNKRIGAIIGGLLLTLFYRLLPIFILILTIIYLLLQFIELICTAQFPWRVKPRENDEPLWNFKGDFFATLPFTGLICSLFEPTNPKESWCGSFTYGAPLSNMGKGIIALLSFLLNLGIKSFFLSTVILNPLTWLIFYLYLTILVAYTLYMVIFNKRISAARTREADLAPGTRPDVPGDLTFLKTIRFTEQVIWGIIYAILCIMLIYNIIRPVNNINSN